MSATALLAPTLQPACLDASSGAPELATESHRFTVTRVYYGVVLAVIVSFAVLSATHRGDTPVAQTCYYGAELAAAFSVLVRALRRRAERAAWAVIGLGLLLWCVGDLLWQFAYASTPGVTPADAFYLSFYPLAYLGMILLLRSWLKVTSEVVRLDGIICALAVGALAGVILSGDATQLPGTLSVATVVNLAYPVGDLLLVGVAFGFVAMLRRLPAGAPLWLLVGAIMLLVADSGYLTQSLSDSYAVGAMLTAAWPLALGCMSYAAWRPRLKYVAAESLYGAVAPTLFGAVAVCILTYDHFERVPTMSLCLASLTGIAILARFWLTFRTAQRLLAEHRVQALTDPLTGIPNRRAMMRDLPSALAPHGAGRHVLLAMFDLDRFKGYNDTFGHLAGDLLLVRLAGRLHAVALKLGARAYRLGGDEFCLLADLAEDESSEALMRCATNALREDGQGFSIGASGGIVALSPGQTDVSQALHEADLRMYAAKATRRRSAFVQSKDVLLAVLATSDPHLYEHTSGVAELAQRVGRQLRLPEDQLLHIGHAAQLHDVGKVALPDEILNKPGPLDEAEWDLVRRHTVIGERIVMAAPELAPVAKLIRSSHERWDGGGYPDGLAGEDIPLGAQVVAVCDAFDAMTSDRVYRRALPVKTALAELREVSGTQLSPRVVDAFLASWAANPQLPLRAPVHPGRHEPSEREALLAIADAERLTASAAQR
jgi:diguanylate cyclase (GGDEF)-like protein